MSGQPTNIQRLRLTAVLELDADMYPPDDEESQRWLVDDILRGDIGRLVLHSNEIGDELGLLRIEQVEVGVTDERRDPDA